jgi:head-tail adaptor
VKFTHRVTIQRGEEIRDSTGGVSYDFEDVEGLESVAATILPHVDELRQERFEQDEARWNVIIAGSHPDITTSMWVVNGDDRYNIVRVHVTKGGKLTTIMARFPTL